MEVLKLSKLLLQVPLGPSRGYVYLINEGVVFEMADFDLGHRDLCDDPTTLIVEKVCSIISELYKANHNQAALV